MISKLGDLRLMWECRLDYPGVGPEHSFLKDIGRAEYYSVTDEEALDGKCCHWSKCTVRSE